MAKKKGNLICTTECEKCIHSKINDKNSVKFHCSAKDKDYYFGQYVSCESMDLNLIQEYPKRTNNTK